VAVTALAAQVATLRQAVLALRTTLVEDRPDQRSGRADHKAVRDLVQAADDLGDAVEAASAALGGPVGDRARCAVAVSGAHRALVVAGQLLRDEVIPVGGRLDAARRAASPWGPPWQAWTRVAQAGALDVAEALSATENAAADAVAALLDPHPGAAAGTDHEEALR
jgi:hypothetical protein